MKAFDVETTGVDLHHGCLPFFFAFCEENGTLRWIEWDVDPYDRTPCVIKSELDEVVDYLCEDETVGHNINFDLRAMQSLLQSLPHLSHTQHHNPSRSQEPPYQLEWNWDAIEDTMIASHALRNLWGHSLKNLREIIFLVDNTKEDRLRQAVNRARQIVRTNAFVEAHGKWRIADSCDPHWPGIDRAPNEKEADIEGWWVCDMWLPRAVANYAPEFLPDFDNYDDPIFHPWQTVLRDYSLEDVETTLPLWHFLQEALQREGLYDNYLERKKVARVAYDMEDVGMTVLPCIHTEVKRYEDEAYQRERKAQVIAAKTLDIDPEEFNCASPKQLSHLLYSQEGFNLAVLKQTKKGNNSTDADTLEKLADQYDDTTLAGQFIHQLRFSRRNATAARYLQGYIRWCLDGRIMVHLNTTGTKFTRQSSNKPNMQNAGTGKEDEQGEIDYNLRNCFGPRPGYVWLAWDYSNIELRLWAYECGNKEFINAFESGVSIHLLIARELFPSLQKMTDDEAKETKEYKRTKNGNFSILYGASPRKANNTYKLAGAYERLNKRFPEVRDFTNNLHHRVLKDGYIETLTGYRLYIPTDEPHKAVSGRIQGTAGAVIGRAMVDCHDYLREHHPCCKLMLQVHDELMFEVPKSYFHKHRKDITTNLVRCMEQQGDRIGVPTPVSGSLITTNWSEGETL